MSNLAIRANDLGKQYRVRQRQPERYTALRDVIAERVRGCFRRPEAGLSRAAAENFWALQDLSFAVRHGEVVGIIGRNGAGKSTLLKILSRITEPTRGRVELDGRVASLLEVGTGFHPELTGRENIFLNGAILGMRRSDIRRQFDEIVAFAGIETFLDTPVKRYSSGMYVRLAFAVAAHLEPDILIVDEVLAVGDAEFQRKCLGKLSEVAAGGRTVLFVSHNMGAIRRLCDRCILIDRGHVAADGSPAQTIDLYLSQATPGLEGGVFVRDGSPAPDQAFFVDRVTTRRGLDEEPTDSFDCDSPLFVCIEYSARRPVAGMHGDLQLRRLDGTIVYEGNSLDAGDDPFLDLIAGTGMLAIMVPPRVLGAGTYEILLNFWSGQDPAGPHIDIPGIVGKFTLHDTSTPVGDRRRGYVSMVLTWSKQPR